MGNAKIIISYTLHETLSRKPYNIAAVMTDSPPSENLQFLSDVIYSRKNDDRVRELEFLQLFKHRRLHE